MQNLKMGSIYGKCLRTFVEANKHLAVSQDIAHYSRMFYYIEIKCIYVQQVWGRT
jgi:hypothetical protein